MNSMKLKLFKVYSQFTHINLSLVTLIILLSFQASVEAAKPTTSRLLAEGIVAFDNGLYSNSQTLFEQSIDLDRSNYESILYLAKTFYILEQYIPAERQAFSLVSSFYPPKKLKIEAFQLLSDIKNIQDNPWLALSYIHAASALSTNVDISHLIDEQMKKLNFNELPYPEYSNDADGVINSSTLNYSNGYFQDQKANKEFWPVSFSVSQLDSKFVALAGFDDRNRFSELLLIRIKNDLRPKLTSIGIQSRKRGGPVGANDLYLKIMDWSFDGYPDLVVRAESKTNGQAFLIFNTKNEKFELSEELSNLQNPVLDKTTKSVVQEDCLSGKKANCNRKRYKLFNGEFALAQFEKNVCKGKASCIYTKSEIEVSSLLSSEHMYLVNTIETQFENFKNRFDDADNAEHTIITRRILKAYYSSKYDVDTGDKPIMFLDLDGSWEFPASYVKEWVNNYFSRQPLDNQLTAPVVKDGKEVIN